MMKAVNERHNLNGAGTPAMAATAPSKPFCQSCHTAILWHDKDEVITCQSYGKPWTLPPTTDDDIRAQVIAELTDLSKPAADLFWTKYIEQKRVRGLLSMGWRPFAE